MISPEDAIKNHFCKTIAAATAGTAAPGATAVGGAAQSAVTTPHPNIAKTQRTTPRGYAVVTAEQQLAVKQALTKNIPSESVRALVTEASPFISTFIERVACLVDYTGAGALNEYAAPGVSFKLTYGDLQGHPMRYAPYHDKAACMTVSRIHGWIAPANNALRFEVIYKADDSGETAKLTHEAIKQPDGEWLFSK
jgi:hypothetical protein